MCGVALLTLKEAEIRNGDWTNPDDGEVLLADYAATWIAERPALRPKTVELYGYLLRRHIVPGLGRLAIADIQPSQGRRWLKQLLDEGVSAVTRGSKRQDGQAAGKRSGTQRARNRKRAS